MKTSRRRRSHKNFRQPETLEQRSLLSAITVTSLADNLDADGQVTLREAVQAANTNASVDGSAAGNGADTIVFAAGLDGVVEMDPELGVIEVSDTLTIRGHNLNKTIIDGGEGDIFEVDYDSNQPTFRLKQLRLRNAATAIRFYSGRSLSLDNVRLVNNDRAIVAEYSHSVTVNRSEIVRNRRGIFAEEIDGAVRILQSNISENRFLASHASGVGLDVFDAGRVEIRDSTFAKNFGKGTWSRGVGARIDVHTADTEVEIVNSTFSGNRGVSDSRGDWVSGTALQVKDAVTLDIVGSTFADNIGHSTVALHAWRNASDMDLSGSIFVNNATRDLDIDWRTWGSSRDVSISHSLVGRNSGSGLSPSATPDANGNLVGSSATPLEHGLEDLAWNGGRTKTHLPGAGSLAIDAGHAAPPTDSDQRSMPRLAGPAADMGSVELSDYVLRVSPALTVTEGVDNHAVFDLMLETDTPITIHYQTSDLTTTADADYTAVSGELVFDSTTPAHQISIPIIDDADVELTEQFELLLQGDPNVLVGQTNRALVTIDSDDTGSVLQDRVVIVVANGQANAVTVTASGDEAIFDVDGRQQAYALADFDSVNARLFGGNDSLVADSSFDFPFDVNAGGGNDSLTTAAGDDTIISLGGDNMIAAGGGHDLVRTGDGSDTITSGGGNDTVRAGDGRDSVHGGSGQDSLDGGQLHDTLVGGPGADILLGRTGHDKLYGEDGDDSILGGAGNDRIEGGDGNDWLRGWETETDNHRVSHPEWIFGGRDGSDYITGGAGEDVIEDRGGDNNRLFGGGGNDHVSMSHRLDGGLINGGSGDDTISGGNGDVFGGPGNDSVSGRGRADGGPGNDAVSAHRFDRDGTTLIGGPGRDTLTGADGPDLLLGGDKADFLRGRRGDDTLSGGRASDKLYGHEGNDYLEGGEGHDLINGDIGDDTLMGQEGNDRLKGLAGNDLLIGGHGNDEINGFEGDDILVGGLDSDSLLGADGTDLLMAGSTSLTEADLGLVAAEWSSGRTVAERVANLRDGSGTAERANGDVFLVPESTVLDDGPLANDELSGEANIDWFFAHSLTDSILDQDENEFFDDLNP